MKRRSVVVVAASMLVLVLLAGAALIVRSEFFRPNEFSAVFTAVRGIYPGDEVRISGVKVGTISAITPAGTTATVVMDVDPKIRVPADAKAVIVAQNVVSARYVQLAPGYEGGPLLADGAVIPLDRTAIPVEWDEVKTQLTRLATELGPNSQTSTTSVARFLDSAATAMDGNGAKLREMLAQLSGVGRILAGGSGNITDILTNLQTFVTTLRDSKTQIVQFQDRLATLSSTIDGSRSDLDAALTNLAQAVGEVQRFIAGSRDQTSEQVRGLASVTQTLVDQRKDLEQVLHVAPNAAANAYNFYDPVTGTFNGNFVLNTFENPQAFLCGAIGAVENATGPETGKLCSQTLGPLLRLLSINGTPVPLNPFIAKAPGADKMIYTDPRLAPGGGGTGTAPEPPPVVSAYTGLDNDVPPPASYPAPPPVMAPVPVPAPPTSIGDMLLPPATLPDPALLQNGEQPSSPPLPAESPLPGGHQ